MIGTTHVRGDIAVLTIDNPPVNAVSRDVRAAIIGAVQALAAATDLSALVIACAGRTFIAGADIREFALPPEPPFLPDVIEAIIATGKPVIAAIHGTALGGGLEIAMACHYRVAAPGAKFGLPEVRLGLMPGARGTQLLPRLVGVERALDMACTGVPIDVATAIEAGLVDALASGDLVDEAVRFAQTVVGRPVVRTCDRPVPAPDAGIFKRYLELNARKFRHLAAPPAIAAAIKAATALPYEAAAAHERQLFLELREGEQSRALRHVFAAERAAAKLPELDGVTPRAINLVGIIGAGTMGTGIAINFLLADLPVVLVEQDKAALDRGLASITRTITASVAKGRISRTKADRALAQLRGELDISALATADLVIEAAFETMEVKRTIFSRLGQVAKPGAILASNTSYLDIDEIAAAGGRPSDTLGLHFFSPANVMKLLEVVRGGKTSADVLATALSLARSIGKIPVVAGNGFGFIGNRMLAVRRAEAEAMVIQGVSPYDVDRVMESFGMPMGPFRIGDLAGLDLGWSAETSTGSTIRERLCEAGRRGQKVGAGYYDYDEQNRPLPSPAVAKIIEDFARDKALPRRSLSGEDILARMIWPMVDEGERLLAEGIARSRGDIDVVWLHGYGWPAWTGGPMFHAAATGYGKGIAAMREMGREPSEALLRAAAQ